MKNNVVLFTVWVVAVQSALCMEKNSDYHLSRRQQIHRIAMRYKTDETTDSIAMHKIRIGLLTKDEEGNTFLHALAQTEFIKVTALILQSSTQAAPTKIRNNKKQLPIHVAIQANQPAMVKLLLPFYTAAIDPLLTQAVQLDYCAIAELILTLGARIDCSWLLTQVRSVQMAELLLAHGAQLNYQTWLGTPLHCAQEQGKTEIAEFLKRKGAVARNHVWLANCTITLQ